MPHGTVPTERSNQSFQLVNRVHDNSAQVVPNFGISVSNVDMADVANVVAAIQPGVTKLVMVESPTNPRMQVCKVLPTTTRVAHALCPWQLLVDAVYELHYWYTFILEARQYHHVRAT